MDQIEKLKLALAKEKDRRLAAEKKLLASEAAFYNAIDQLREEKSMAEIASKEMSIELEEFARFSNQSPYATMRLNLKGEVVYSNSVANNLLMNLDKTERKEITPLFFERLKNSLRNQETITDNFQVKDALYHVTFAPHINLEDVNIFAVDISEQARLRKYFEVLSDFSTSLLEANDEESLAWTITQKAIAKLGYVDCVVYLRNPISGNFVQKAAHGPKNPKKLELVSSIELKPGQGIVGHVAQSKVGEYINDVSIDPRYVADDAVRFSEIAVPIIINNEVAGVIDSEHPDKNFFTDEDLSILNAIASAASMRLQKIKTQNDLRKGEERFKYFIENAFGGIYILRNAQFDYVNDPLCEILGFTKEEILDPEFNFVKLLKITGEDAAAAFRERYDGDHEPKSYKLEITTKSGHTKHLAVNSKVLEDEKGPYTLGILLDITFLEESRKQTRNLNEELQKKNKELGQFAHLASHNLRAPVTNLMGLLEHYDRDKEMDETNIFILGEFDKSVHSLHRILEEMHEVLQVRAEKHNRFTPVNLNECVEDVKNLIKDQITQSGAEIYCNFEIEDLKYVKSHIDNIMLNMITNAIKYTSPDIAPKIEILSNVKDSQVNLIFKDNGLGINLDRHRNEMFGMYKRFHNHPDSRGLGLYLIKTQLDALGGTISVESEVGKGTEFTITLLTK